MANRQTGMVRKFRNEEVFKSDQASLETHKMKFEAKVVALNELASRAGCQTRNVNAACDYESKPERYYPALDLAKKEGGKAYKIYGEFGTWGWNTGSRRLSDFNSNNLPVELLEELAVANAMHFFADILVCTHHDNITSYMFIGRRGNMRYPIAYWGDEDLCRKMQAKLNKLEEANSQSTEAAATTNVPWHRKQVPALVVAMAIVCELGGIAKLAHYYDLGNQQTSGQISLTDKEAAAQLTFHKIRDHDGVPVMSLDQLPRGTVVDKFDCACPYCDGGCFYLVYVSQTTGLAHAERRVTKKVFDSLKVGDILLPKPKGKPKPSEDF